MCEPVPKTDALQNRCREGVASKRSMKHPSVEKAQGIVVVLGIAQPMDEQGVLRRGLIRVRYVAMFAIDWEQ